MTPEQKKYVEERRAHLNQNLRIYPIQGLPPQDQIVRRLIEIIDQQEKGIIDLKWELEHANKA